MYPLYDKIKSIIRDNCSKPFTRIYTICVINYSIMRQYISEKTAQKHSAPQVKSMFLPPSRNDMSSLIIAPEPPRPWYTNSVSPVMTKDVMRNSSFLYIEPGVMESEAGASLPGIQGGRWSRVVVLARRLTRLDSRGPSLSLWSCKWDSIHERPIDGWALISGLSLCMTVIKSSSDQLKLAPYQLWSFCALGHLRITIARQVRFSL